MTDNMWGYPAESGHRTGTDLIGFKVEASDGSIGKVDKHSEDVGAAYIVVDTGVWIFGKQVLLPAGVISSIDVAERTIHVGRTKDEIKNSPSSTRTSTSVTPATTSSSAATTETTEPDRHPAAHGAGTGVLPVPALRRARQAHRWPGHPHGPGRRGPHHRRPSGYLRLTPAPREEARGP